MENPVKPKAGKKASSFCLKDASGEKVCLKDFLGKKVVLYFYPKDNTPGCTLEAIDFTANKKEFEKLNSVVLGISRDSCESHRKFSEKHSLSIILLSDPDLKVQKKYGVWGKKKFMGREFMGTIRTTFLINEKGKITKVWEKVKVKGHVQEVLEELRTK